MERLGKHYHQQWNPGVFVCVISSKGPDTSSSIMENITGEVHWEKVGCNGFCLVAGYCTTGFGFISAEHPYS